MKTITIAIVIDGSLVELDTQYS